MKSTEPQDEIEKMLGRMKSADPGEALMARLRAARPEPVAKVIRFHRWLPFAVAACLALVLAMNRHGREKSNPFGAKNPVLTSRIPLETRQHLMEVADIGVMEDRSEKPVRLIRTTWVDEIVYAAGPDGKRMTESRIRQEVLPVSLEIF